MTSETITTYFTTSAVTPAAPSTGLSPTISIWKVSDNTALVNEAAMTEVGGGYYKYTFTTYDPTVRVVFRCHSAVTTGDFRYTWGSNTDDLQMVGKLPTNYIMGSSVASNKDTTIDNISLYTDTVEGTLSTISLSQATNYATLRSDIAAVPTVGEINDELELYHGTGLWDTTADLSATNALITNLDGDVVNSTNGRLASISGIPALARAEMDANSTKFASMTSTLARIAGLVHENTYVTFTYDGNSDNTTSTIQLYDTKANADTHNGTAGLVATYNMTATYAAHVPATVKVTKA